MDVYAKALLLQRKCEDFITIEFVRDENNNPIEIKEHLKENVPEEVRSAFLELSEIKNSGILAEIR